MLGIAEATLNEWRIRGEGPAYTEMGRLVRYPVSEVQRYIRERTIETPTERGLREGNGKWESRFNLNGQRILGSPI